MSTLEILIALALVTLAMAAAILVVFGNQSTSVDTQTNIEALAKARALLEQERALAREDFDSVASIPETSDDIYSKKITVSYPDSDDPDTKLVISQVSWMSGIRPLSVSLSTLVRNSAGSSCSATNAADWSSPSAWAFDTATDMIEQATGNNSNGLGISGINVYRKKLYIAAAYTANDNNSFYIFDLPANPSQLPVFEGRTATVGASLAAVTVAAHDDKVYAYVANAKNFDYDTCMSASSCPQLQVIDVTDSTSPSVVGNVKMPVTVTYTSGIGGQGTGNVITYSGGYVYLGLVKPASGPEFNIIDVSDPTHPVRVGGYTVGRTINSITVKGDYAYLTTSDNATGNKQLLILDVSNKSMDPVPVAGYFSAPGIGYGYTSAIEGTKLYFGRSYSSSPNFYIFDASTPSSLSTTASLTTGTSDSIYGLGVRDNLAYMLINNSANATQSRFQVMDVSNPSSISAVGSISLSSIVADLQGNGSNFSGSAALSCTGSYFYLALKTGGSNKDIFAIIGPHVDSSYTLSNTGDLTVTQGGSGSDTVNATVSSGFPATVAFSASGLPSGTSAAFSPGSCTPSCSSTLTLTTSASTPAGAYPITITGTGGMTTTLTLNVTAASQPFDYTLTPPSSQTLSRSSSIPVSVTIMKTSGDAQSVAVSLSGLQNGVTSSPTSGSCTPSSGSCTVSFTLTAAGNAQKKTSTITVNGSSPAHTTTFDLTVQ
ncbi:MAG: LVIVD repeat-containing protein [Bacillota bacterium]